MNRVADLEFCFSRRGWAEGQKNYLVLFIVHFTSNPFLKNHQNGWGILPLPVNTPLYLTTVLPLRD